MSTAPEQRFAFDDILSVAKGLLEAESDPIATMANISSLLYEALPHVNWVGFYILRDGELVLGPFQGRVACTRIAVGRGVCGAAAETCRTQRVDDVHAFPGHIACDGASESEIVIPVIVRGKLYGVLDIDSPQKERFSVRDQEMLEHLVHELEGRL
ncbi:GAF domain-containing protein [Saccharibacter sp. 17.LH.SD]|uniref:GAF domain-containing protein n=1 Tax=Saccharibacter sp. 17.LH.SD TaxID=2689393 RepID=UPI001371393A|nr:GAF domain-containing protein [Saccharibacter sp. 17.LH.SD]MXV44143.1 GAF domain-containing protein [Saccharibacter sp. 17.LH.SD]